MGFGVRAFFPGANTGLRQFITRFNLTPPVSLRTLTAHAAIAQRYQELGHYKGRLGVALSSVNSDTPTLFVQSFEGGNLQFTTEDGNTKQDRQDFITISYQGSHCFGSPKFPKSNKGYVIVIIYKGNDRDKTSVIKIPDDPGGSTYVGWDDGVDQTQGQGVIYGNDKESVPSKYVIETLVMGHEPFGDPKQVKQTIQDAVKKTADATAEAEGLPPDSIPPAAINILTEGLFAILDGLFGLTDQVRGRPVAKTIERADWYTLPPINSKKIGSITYNWATDLMTDGDASYGAYFNLEKRTIDV